MDHKEFKKVTFLTWTVTDAAKAVDRGYFIERSAIDNHAVIIVLHTFTTDANVIDVETERAKGGDEHGHKLLWFVYQQDQYGWNGTWESETIATYRPSLTWYKHLKGATRRARDAADSAGDARERARANPGRPRGTLAQRLEIEDLQSMAWRESDAFANDVPFADWLATQPTLSSVPEELERLRAYFGIEPPPAPERKPRGRPRKWIDGKGPIFRRNMARLEAAKDTDSA